MKKIITMSVLCLGVIFLAGCGQQQASNSQPIKKVPTEQQNFDVMNFMEEARIYATFCNDKKTEIVSANGGEKFCDEGKAYENINRLRKMDFCGKRPEDTKWIVSNGKSSNWSIELNCKDFTSCNGKSNASCNVGGCIFSKSCDPRKK